MKRKVLVPVLAVIVILLAIVIIMKKNSRGTANIKKLSKGFMTCLPDTLKKAQIDEVSATMERFRRSVKEGAVAPDDQKEVESDLEQYVAAGKISMDELAVFLAKVDYYIIRQGKDNRDLEGKTKPPTHPLLEKPGK